MIFLPERPRGCPFDLTVLRKGSSIFLDYVFQITKTQWVIHAINFLWGQPNKKVDSLLLLLRPRGCLVKNYLLYCCFDYAENEAVKVFENCEENVKVRAKKWYDWKYFLLIFGILNIPLASKLTKLGLLLFQNSNGQGRLSFWATPTKFSKFT